ncbi:MAG: cation transporter [Paludibacteraceae bacterium]|nr:cation transporter [Paludibacteraceae bacterium]
MSHHHHHHEHAAPQTSDKRMRSILIISIVLNLLFVIIEAGVGIWKDSLSLLSDAGHNLSDVFSLALVLVGFYLAQRAASSRYTYGYKKSTILISLLNALLLLVAVGIIIAESIHKLRTPVAIDGAAISWTAGVGILVNGITTLLLMHGQQNDLNVRGAFLHMAADTLVSIGVVISGIIIAATGWYIIDPVISLVIALVILVSTWELLHDSVRLALDGVPENVEINHLREQIEQTPHVLDVHHIHVWAMSTTENALTAHIVVDDLSNAHEAVHTIKHQLAEQGICHATIETELPDDDCDEKECH